MKGTREEAYGMSLVTFVPVEGTDYKDGWPEELIGDGFIRLHLWNTNLDWIGAIYRDQFKDEYELEDSGAGEWEVEVRED